MTGSIPTELLRLPKLEELFLDANFFNGSLPADACASLGGSLTDLSLSNNEFSGTLDLRGCRSLISVNLNNNKCGRGMVAGNWHPLPPLPPAGADANAAAANAAAAASRRMRRAACK